MDVNGLLNTLYGRAYWSDARKIIAMSGLSPAKGWANTLARYSKANVDSDVANTLSDLLADHMVAGEKSLQFYRLKKDQKTDLLTRFDAAKILNSQLASDFPNIADLGKYKGISGSPKLVFKRETTDGHFLFFASVRPYDLKEKVDVSLLPPALQTQLSGYRDVFGIKTIDHSAIDVIWIPSNGNTVVVASDSPQDAAGNYCEGGHVQLRAFIRSVVGDDAKPLNLFSAIDNIYRSDWGKVVELSFATDTGSIKNEKMRLKRQCLRVELFHVGGRTAVSENIHPFHISVDWAAANGSTFKWRPEMTLHSGVRMLHSGAPQLYSALFKHSLRIRDLRVLKSKLMKLL